MQLNDLEQKRVKNIMRRMAKVLRFAFMGKSDIYVGFYALLTAQAMITSYLKEDCKDAKEFSQARVCLVNTLTDIQREIFAIKFNGSEGK